MERLEDTLRRLREERDEADRRYNDALTALDRALPPAPRLPDAAPGYDESQITPLNDAWNILAASPPGGGGLAGRLRGLVWRTVAPYLQQQLAFNSRLVDHLNRNAIPHREAHRAIQEVVAAARERAARDAEFQSRLIVLLQQITAYVDTRNREAGGGVLVLNAAQSAMAEEFAKRWESMAVQEAARVARHDARASAVAAEIAEVRTAAAAAQHAAMAVKRAMELDAPGRAANSAPAARPRAADDELHGALNAYKYVGFENQFRGSRELIRTRLESYLPIFEGVADVLDVGCGRGEFLELLKARGIEGRGLDVNEEMVAECRSRGLDAVHGDAVTYLASLPDASLGGLFAAQVVEHLEPAYLLRFLELSFHKLRPGGVIVLETLNPACWVAFFESYIRDITHRWPLHPETLKYFVLASGFSSARIEWRSPVAPDDRLQLVQVPAGGDPLAVEVAEAFNANVAKLNARIFSHMDYAIVGAR